MNYFRLRREFDLTRIFKLGVDTSFWTDHDVQRLEPATTYTVRMASLSLNDYYDNWVNSWRQGNGGEVFADAGPLHDFPQSARVTLPANSICVFAS